jgi:NTE family protein
VVEATRVSLDLGSGGGGARGYAHIGVIQALEEHGCDVVAVSGTSMGALVGGLYAAGRLPEYAEWVSALSQRDVLRLLDPSLHARGLIRGEKVMGRVRELLDGVRIEDLPIPYTAVATDLLTGREVWFQKGPVEVAMRASVALPSFITPVMLDGRLLADGGLVNPIPIAPLAAIQADAVVAVSLLGEESAESIGLVPEPAGADPRETPGRLRRGAAQALDHEAMHRVTDWLGNLRTGHPVEAQVDDAGPVFGELPDDLGMLDVVQLSLDAVQSVVARYRLASYPPDLLISIPKRACRTLDFHRGAEMIALGRRLTEEALERNPLPRSAQGRRLAAPTSSPTGDLPPRPAG